jgi:hypothetical protein
MRLHCHSWGQTDLTLTPIPYRLKVGFSGSQRLSLSADILVAMFD